MGSQPRADHKAVATVTLNEIRAFGPCADGWGKLLRSLGKTEADDTLVQMSQILESNDLNDAIWCLRVFHKNYRQRVIDFACDCAERALATWEEWAKVNAPEHLEASRRAIEAARGGDQNAARAAARAAADAARAAADAARAAADAARAAAYAARAAAYAADDADASRAAAAAARAAAAAAEKKEQEKLLVKHFG